MKKCFVSLSFLILILFSSIYSQNWVPVTSGSSSALSSITFPNENSGWISGSNNTLLRTVNGGDSWSYIYVPYSWNRIRFIDNSRGFGNGLYSKIVITTDGGVTWSERELGINGYIYSIAVIDTATVYAAFGNGMVAKTTDGGLNFSVSNTGNIDGISEIHFADKDIGFAACGSGKIFRTTNGGSSWVLTNSSAVAGQGYFYSVFFVTPDIGFAGSLGFIVKTTDRGDTWTRTDVEIPNENIEDIWFTDVNTGYFSQGYRIYKTTNGGSSWFMDAMSGAPLYHIAFTPSGKGFCVGSSGTILKYQPGTSVNGEGQVPYEFNLDQNFPNPFNPSTVINYSVPGSGIVTLKIFDPLGSEVATLVNEFKDAGTYNYHFSADNFNLSSGVYFYELRASNLRSVKKLMFVK